MLRCFAMTCNGILCYNQSESFDFILGLVDMNMAGALHVMRPSGGPHYILPWKNKNLTSCILLNTLLHII